jgi:succinate dehydrogenase / fumarate reductase, membrane anchor subunit
MAVATRAEMRARQVARSKQPNTFWPWFLQRVTGVFLVVLLAVHIGVNHFGNLDKPGVRERERELIVFSDVAHRMTMALWWVIDIALLAFVLFHGLNGIRNIALDLGVKSTGDRAITILLTVIGVAAFAFGIAGLIAFQRFD